MAATNLYEYYQSKGQALPSLADRAKIYESSGLGSAASYGGTATQNAALLGKLATPSPVATPTAQYTAPIGPTMSGAPLPSSVVPNIPTVKEIPGIGTLTSVPKSPVNSAAFQGPDINRETGAYAPGQDAALYARTGVTPPAPTKSAAETIGTKEWRAANVARGTSGPTKQSSETAEQFAERQRIFIETGNDPGYLLPSNTPSRGSPSGATTPTYGKKETPADTSKDSIMEAYNTLSKQIDQIEADLKSSTLKSADEKRLEQDLVAKRAALAAFDTDTLGRLEAYQGQGRGATTRNVAARQDQERRTRALERLGLAQEADTLMDQLAIAQDDRKLLSTNAQNQLTLAGKRLDIALGIQGKLDKMEEDERNDARQFLLDVVAFSEGKSYDELDSATQQEINNAVANSPLTLGMVKTALAKGAETSNELDELLSPAEAKSYNVPYGTTKGQISGKTAPKESSSSSTEGGYTDQELRKLRAAGVDSTDIEGADRYLYGDGVRSGVLTIPELESVSDALYTMFTDLSKTDPEDRDADDPDWTSIEDVKNFINDYGIVDINDQKIKLTDLQKNVITQSLEVKAQEDQGFFSKVFGFGR